MGEATALAADEIQLIDGKWPADKTVAMMAVNSALSGLGFYFRGMTEADLHRMFGVQDSLQFVASQGGAPQLAMVPAPLLSVEAVNLLKYSFPHIGPNAILYMTVLAPTVEAIAQHPSTPVPLRQFAHEHPVALALAIGLAIGVAFELFQGITHTGTPEAIDLVANNMGYALALLMPKAIDLVMQKQDGHVISDALHRLVDPIAEQMGEAYHGAMFDRGVANLLSSDRLVPGDEWLKLMMDHGATSRSK
ncbi:hypothetical protein GC177_07715 [bacterium]|nr:hypothetical protein [bacterium]